MVVGYVNFMHVSVEWTYNFSNKYSTIFYNTFHYEKSIIGWCMRITSDVQQSSSNWI